MIQILFVIFGLTCFAMGDNVGSDRVLDKTISKGNRFYLPRLVNSIQAVPGEFPFVVSIRYKNELRCGGSLISPTRVLTAGHCITEYLPGGTHSSNLEYLSIVAGGTSLDVLDGMSYRVASVHPHPDYAVNGYVDDIAIIKLRNSVDLSAAIQVIQLPTSADIPVGARVKVSGFGIYQVGNPTTRNHKISRVMRKVQVAVIDNRSCQDAWSTYRSTWDMKIYPSHVCTSTYMHNGFCGGDSGSPLIYNNQVVGIVSFGDVNCASGLPDVATRVGSYLDFINYHLNH